MMEPRDAKQRNLSKTFRALGDATRRGILEKLAREGPQHVGALVKPFGLAQPTISRHLAVLREADLVVDSRKGQQVIYELVPEGLEEINAFLKVLT